MHVIQDHVHQENINKMHSLYCKSVVYIQTIHSVTFLPCFNSFRQALLGFLLSKGVSKIALQVYRVRYSHLQNADRGRSANTRS